MLHRDIDLDLDLDLDLGLRNLYLLNLLNLLSINPTCYDAILTKLTGCYFGPYSILSIVNIVIINKLIGLLCLIFLYTF